MLFSVAYTLLLFILYSCFRDPAGIRTQDPYIKSVLLYQLSYQIVFPSDNKSLSFGNAKVALYCQKRNKHLKKC